MTSEDRNALPSDLAWLTNSEMDVPSFYVDHFMVRITPNGVRIAFGEKWEATQGRPRVAVTLSHHNASSLGRIITEGLKTLPNFTLDEKVELPDSSTESPG